MLGTMQVQMLDQTLGTGLPPMPYGDAYDAHDAQYGYDSVGHATAHRNRFFPRSRASVVNRAK